MDLALSPEDEAFRDEVRRFLDDNLSEDLREAGRKTGGVFADIAAGLRWHKVLAQRGWSAPSWPTEYGGTGWSATQRYIFARECTAADAPRIFAMGIRMVGPVIMKYGTPEQKAKYLPAIVSGDIDVLPGLLRAGLGLRPRQPQDARGARRRRLRHQRHQDLDDRRACRRPHVLPGAHLDRGQAAGRHLLRADRFDEDAGPQREADRDPGRRPRGQPGVLRQCAHAGRQPHRAGECRLDGRQVPARVRARRRCLHAQPLCPHRGHQAHRPRGGGRRLGPADRRARLCRAAGRGRAGDRRRWR